MFFILSVVLLLVNIDGGSAQKCIQPEKIKVEIYDDAKCTTMNLGETKNNELSQAEV